MNRGIKLGRLFGINIWLDWSWLLVFVLISWNLTMVFREAHPGWSWVFSVGIAAAAALLFFASVLAHEIAHSLVAISQGLPVRSITLWLFGGVANIQREPPSPKAEFLITIVGPFTSVVLGVLFTILGLFVSNVGNVTTTTDPANLLQRLSPLATLLLWLGPVNIFLGVFNLIPGFPLDGGRILRSILWAITDNLRRATFWASLIGQGVAWLMIIAGIAMTFGVNIPFLGTGLISGIWLAFIGWFLNSASIQSYRQVVVRDLLEDVEIARIMRPNPPTIPPDMSVDDLVYRYFMESELRAFPVGQEGRLLGLITMENVRELPREQWATTPVSVVMMPLSDLPILNVTDDAEMAMEQLNQKGTRQLPVLDRGQFVGIVGARDIMKWLQLQGDF